MTVGPTVTVDSVRNVGLTMTSSFSKCPSCMKTNKPDSRYCIYCGSIMNPVFCSSCGTVNPEGLPQCLECGNQIPRLSEIHWNPIVTVIQSTSGMTEVGGQNLQTEIEPPLSVKDTDERQTLRWLRDRFARKEQSSGD